MASAPNSDAFWAYRQSAGNQVRAYGTCVTEHEGKHYVVLKNVNGILAVQGKGAKEMTAFYRAGIREIMQQPSGLLHLGKCR